jgi:hypothetical protein
MRIKVLSCAVLLALAGCQSGLDSQRPPSSEVRREYIEPLHRVIKPGHFLRAEIAREFTIPRDKIYVYCTRTTERGNTNWSYVEIVVKDKMIVDMTKDEPRCHDKRLRYYDFPELRNM